jgi:hypothetical protein
MYRQNATRRLDSSSKIEEKKKELMLESSDPTPERRPQKY